MTEDKPITEEEVAELEQLATVCDSEITLRLIADWRKLRERVEELEKENAAWRITDSPDARISAYEERIATLEAQAKKLRAEVGAIALKLDLALKERDELRAAAGLALKAIRLYAAAWNSAGFNAAALLQKALQQPEGEETGR